MVTPEEEPVFMVMEMPAVAEVVPIIQEPTN